jgi:hypothetical protein
MKDELLSVVALNLTEKLTEKLIEKEVVRQRVFAILSRLNAGKTTSGKKLLLCAIAVDQPGRLRVRASCARIVVWHTQKINQNLPCKSIQKLSRNLRRKL